jgi:hypothetical protein
MPASWRQAISGKQVILYNTTIAALLYYNEQYLAKMRDVFAVFANTPDMVLWWRPHPLLESTLASMRPDLLKEYQEAKQYFIDNNIGIYDDTADLHRVIRESDAYYGDNSSVLTLYKETGKRMMLQDADIVACRK